MSSFFIKGLNSCPMRNQNIYKYRKYLCDAGYTESVTELDADIVLLWTCSFREDMAENSFSCLKEIIERSFQKPSQICVAGCMPDILPERFSEIKGVTIIPWKSELQDFASYFPPINGKDISMRDYWPVYSESPIQRENGYFMDSFIKLLVSEGCNEQCTYCSERLAFPPYRSFPISDLIDEARRRIYCKNAGAQKDKGNIIALIGDSTGDYGNDIDENIITLIYSLCDIEDNVKIVLHNFNPVFILKYMKEFKSLIHQNKLHHLNLPIQSASNRVLKAMRRRYTKEELSVIFDSLKECGFDNYDTHIIAGFPTESADEFDETLDFLSVKHPKYVLASPCMIAPTAPANSLAPKISEGEKRRRLIKLDEYLSHLGIIVNTPYNQIAKRRIDSINSL